MEKREGKILWSKGGSGSDTTRITLPVAWIRKMGITTDLREVEILFDENTNKIIIQKTEIKTNQ
ncbi:hypothetical protein [Cetobacterium sp. ZOR0034]|uniref:hypothetical protein n=1 Tax=Cetobacterium sp. ZOR0034 TaxID=1339239 RepID=UPI000647A463|nr:hypothetical protein [Cetobacterium sp. ZOR0034]